MGSEIKYSPNNIAQLKTPALTLRNVDSAKLVNVDKDGRLSIILEGLRTVKQLMEVIVENSNRYIQRLIDLGVGIGFADPVSSTSLISVEQYKEFSLPYFRKDVDCIKSQGRGCGLHICGGSRALWELLIETGIGTFGPDNVEDMAEAKEILGPHMCIQGNVRRWKSCATVRRRMFCVPRGTASKKPTTPGMATF